MAASLHLVFPGDANTEFTDSAKSATAESSLVLPVNERRITIACTGAAVAAFFNWILNSRRPVMLGDISRENAAAEFVR